MHIDGKTHAALARALVVLERKSSRTASPPEGARKAGRRAQELIKAGKAGQGFTSAGRTRAAQLAAGKELSEATIRRMHAYFSRHQGDKKPGWSDSGKETPGYVAWLAWGGDAGRSWAAAQVRKWDREDGKKSFPRYLPDGSEVETVDQVAVMLKCDPYVAAQYVLEEKGLSPALYEEAKVLKPPPSGDKSGVALMLLLPQSSAQQLAQAGGTLAEDLHITLGYWGDVADMDNDDQLTLKALADALAVSFDPFTVMLNGLTRFSTPSDAGDPIVVNADSPEIERMRSMLVELTRHYDMPFKSEHGYTPHMTIGYVDTDEKMPLQRWEPVEVPIRMFTLSLGTNHVIYKLGESNGQAKDVFNGNPHSRRERRDRSIAQRAEVLADLKRRKKRGRRENES